jgi:hypothetical protein
MNKKQSIELLNTFFKVNKSSRQWHLPIVAGISVGIPMIFGWYINNMQAGQLMSLAGLSILYIQSNKLAERMIILMTCCFGFITAYTIGLFFSFSPIIAPIMFGLLSFGVHFSLYRLRLTRPPGNFFFIMLASSAFCTPFQLESIPDKIGFLAIGSILTCGLAFIYSILTLKNTRDNNIQLPTKSKYTNIVESLIFGFVMAISLVVAFALDIEKPYWIPISCLAVMQGGSSSHIWLRAIQRIIGTLVGLGLTWLIVSANPTPLMMVVSITILQIIIEFLVVRNYGITVVFITVLTIFLSESGGELTQNTNQVFAARLLDIVIGSSIGMIGGWFLFNEKIHYQTTLKLRKSKVFLNKIKNK